MYQGKTRVAITLTLPTDESYVSEQESFVGDTGYDSERQMLFDVFYKFLKSADLVLPESHFLSDELTFDEMLFLSQQLNDYRKNKPEEMK